VKALVFGCGEMGEEAIQELYQNGGLDEILVATRNPDRVGEVAGRLSGKETRIRAERVDLDAGHDLAPLIKGYDVAVNCAGPNYKYEVPVAQAAIRAGVSLVDINDDYETTFRMLDLDAEARRAGVLVILGLGASPGINNVLVRAAADKLDTVEEIHTAWVMSGADPGGRALSYHLLYSLSGQALTVQDGRMVEVRSFVDGRERLEFPPPVGPLDVYYIGHPEPITLSRAFPEARVVNDKATFHPSFVNDLIIALGGMARQAKGPLSISGHDVDPMDYAVECFHAICKGLPQVPKEGALRVEVRGRRRGRPWRVFFSSAGRIGQGTGIPAGVGAEFILHGRVQAKGVKAPEECLEPREFMAAVLSRNIGQLNGWEEEG